MTKLTSCPRCGRTYSPADRDVAYCRACHAYADQWLCIRLKVAGDVVVEHWIDVDRQHTLGAPTVEDLRELALADQAVAQRAAAAGLHWQLEAMVRPGVTVILGEGPDISLDLQTALDLAAQAMGLPRWRPPFGSPVTGDW